MTKPTSEAESRNDCWHTLTCMIAGSSLITLHHHQIPGNIPHFASLQGSEVVGTNDHTVPSPGFVNTTGGALDSLEDSQAAKSKMRRAGDMVETVLTGAQPFPQPVHG